jgi:hypothetical protein
VRAAIGSLPLLQRMKYHHSWRQRGVDADQAEDQTDNAENQSDNEEESQDLETDLEELADQDYCESFP